MTLCASNPVLYLNPYFRRLRCRTRRGSRTVSKVPPNGYYFPCLWGVATTTIALILGLAWKSTLSITKLACWFRLTLPRYKISTATRAYPESKKGDHDVTQRIRYVLLGLVVDGTGIGIYCPATSFRDAGSSRESALRRSFFDEHRSESDA